MTSRVRVEMVTAAPGTGAVALLLSTATIEVDGTTVVQSQAMPQTPATIYGPIALLSVAIGAVVCTWDGSVPSDSNGLRVSEGYDRRVILEAGKSIKFVESVDQPSDNTSGDTTGLGNFGG